MQMTPKEMKNALKESTFLQSGYSKITREICSKSSKRLTLNKPKQYTHGRKSRICFVLAKNTVKRG